MARYSPTFLNRIGQTPSFGKRLTEIAGGLTAYPGMIAEQNKIKGMGMLDLAKYNLEKARTPAERAQALSVLEQAKQQTANAAIDPLFTAAIQSKDPNQIKSFSQSAQNVASYLGLPTAEIAKNFEGMMTGRQQSNARIAADRLMSAIKQSEDPRIQDSLNKTLVDTLARADLPVAEASVFASQVRAAKEADRLAAARAKDFYDTQTRENRERLEQQEKAQAIEEIQRFQTLLLQSNNPKEQDVYEQKIINIANSVDGIDESQYVGIAQETRDNVAKTNWDRSVLARQQTEAQLTSYVDGFVNQAIIKQDPYAYIDANLPENFQFLKDRIIKTIKEKDEVLASQEELRNSGKLSKRDEQFLFDNKDIFEGIPGVMEEFDIYRNPNSSDRQKRLSAQKLNKSINTERQRQRSLEVSPTFATDSAGIAIRAVLGEEDISIPVLENGRIVQKSLPTGTGFFESPDIVDVARDLYEDKDQKSAFINKVAKQYQLNPNANPREAVTKALEEMGVDTSGEEITQARREDLVGQATQLENLITQALKADGIDPEKATKEQVAAATEKARAGLESRILRDREEMSQRIQSVRDQAKERRYGPSNR